MLRRRRVPRTGPAIIEVSTDGELISALGAATGGEIIFLADGNYDVISLTGKTYTTPITVRSKNRHGAIVQGVIFDSVDNLSFYQIDFYEPAIGADYDYVVLLDSSDHIILEDCVVRSGGDEILDGCRSLVYAVDCPHFQALYNTFTRGVWGVVIWRCDSSVLKNNDLTNLRTTALKMSKSNDVVFDGNYFTGSLPLGEEHFNFIKIQSATLSEGPNHRFSIINNVMVHTTPEVAIAVIVHNELYTGSLDPAHLHEDCTIENNLIYLSGSNGLVFNGLTNSSIQYNTVIRRVDSNIYDPIISSGTNNPSCVIDYNVTHAPVGAHDYAVQYSVWTLSNHLSKIFINPFGARNLSDLLLLPDAPSFDGAGVDYALLPERLRPTPAYYITAALDGEPMAFSAVAYPGGEVSTSPTFEWDFGDGSTATGQDVSHTYVTNTTYDIALSVDEIPAEFRKRINYTGLALPLVSFAFENNLSNDGTIGIDGSGTVTYVDTGAPDNYAVDTTLTYPQVDNVGAVLSDLSKFTISAKIKWTGGAAATSTIMHIQHIYCYQTSTTMYFVVGLAAGGDITISKSGHAIMDGSEHTVKYQFDGVSGVVNIYIDGSLFHTGAFTAGNCQTIATNRSLRIGYHASNGWPWKGLIDNFVFTPALV